MKNPYRRGDLTDLIFHCTRRLSSIHWLLGLFAISFLFGVLSYLVELIKFQRVSITTPVTQSAQPRTPTIYMCGYSQSETAQLLFPEHRYCDPNSPEQLKRIHSRQLHKNFLDQDILLLDGLNAAPVCAGVWETEEDFRLWTTKFPGKLLVMNVESFGRWQTPVRGGVVEMGYHADSQNTLRFEYQAGIQKTIRFTYVQWMALAYGPSTWPKIFNHSLKAKSTKERFMIYAVSNCVSFRDEAVLQLSQIDVVDKAGKCPAEGPPKGQEVHEQPGLQQLSLRMREAFPELLGRDIWTNNPENFGRYRFCLVMENKYQEGYLTEKILNAFLGGCIPIFYGSTEVFDMFNREAFVYYDIADPTKAIELVKYLESNATAYELVMQQPILANGSETIEKYFSFSEQIGNATLLKRIHELLGLQHHA